MPKHAGQSAPWEGKRLQFELLKTKQFDMCKRRRKGFWTADYWPIARGLTTLTPPGYPAACLLLCSKPLPLPGRLAHPWPSAWQHSWGTACCLLCVDIAAEAPMHTWARALLLLLVCRLTAWALPCLRAQGGARAGRSKGPESSWLSQLWYRLMHMSGFPHAF